MLDTLYIDCLKTLPKIPVTKNKISDDPYIAYALPFVEFYRYQYRYQDNGFVPAYERNGQKVKPIFPPKSQVCYIDSTTTRDFKSRKKCPQQEMTNEMDPERAYIPLVGRLGQFNVNGPERFTTPTIYMSYMHVYKIKSTETMMTKCLKFLK